MVPSSVLFDQSTLQQLLDVDPVVLDYRSFFADLEWSRVQQWHAQRSSRGRPAHPESAYLKAFLVRIREGMSYTSNCGAFCSSTPCSSSSWAFSLCWIPALPMALTASARYPVSNGCVRNYAPSIKTCYKPCWLLPSLT